MSYLEEFPIAHYQKYRTQDYCQISRNIKNIKNKSDILDVLKLIKLSENKEYSYYEDENQYTEKERLLILKDEYNDNIGQVFYYLIIKDLKILYQHIIKNENFYVQRNILIR